MRFSFYGFGVACALFVWMIGTSCGSREPWPIEIGKDACVHCRMTIVDARFATELITKKGRVYVFDDLVCMVEYVRSGSIPDQDVETYYLPDYTKDNGLFPAQEAYLWKSESLRSPMRGDIAAFRTEEDLRDAQASLEGELLSWTDIWNETGG